MSPKKADTTKKKVAATAKAAPKAVTKPSPSKPKRNLQKPTPSKLEPAKKPQQPTLDSFVSKSTEFKYTTKLLSATKSKNSPGDLQIRLRELNTQLSNLSNGEANSKALTEVSKDLIQPQFTSGKDEGVKVLTGCCLAEMLRLFAPEAPFSDSELGTIFHLFLDLFKKLGKEDSPFSQFYTSVLLSIATVKSINLIDTKDDQLIQDYFLTGFKLAESNISRDNKLRLVDILEQLASGIDVFPIPVIEVILKQFSKKRQIECPHAFAMAKSICISAPENLQGSICQYFTDVLSCVKEEDDEESSRPTIDLEQAHDMIRMIYTFEPKLLLSVIAQLEAQLTVVRADLRRLALVTLGTFFVLPSVSILLGKYPTLWKSWIQRRFDQDAQIRILLIQQSAELFNNITPVHLIADVCDAVEGLVQDQDEKVRAAACKMIGQLPYSVAKKHVPTSLLKKVALRCKDRKELVRRNLQQMMAALYAESTSDLDDGDVSALEKFKWIPGELLENVYSNDAHIILDTERAFRDTILGSVDNMESRTENLLRVVTWLQPRAYDGLRILQTWQTSLIKDFRIFLEASRKIGGESSDLPDTQDQLYSKLKILVPRMTKRLPEPQKADESLLRYPKSNDRKINDLFKTILEAENPAISKAAEKEVMKRTEQIMPALSDLFGMLLLRLGPTLFCRDMIPNLIRIADQESSLSPAAHKVLKDLPSIDHGLFQGYVSELGNLVLSSGADWLPTLAQYAKASPTTSFPNDKVAKRLARFVLEGTTDQAKDAATALSQFDSGLKHSTKTVQAIVKSLSLSSAHLAGHLSALGEMVSKHPEVTESNMPSVLEFVIKTLLPSPSELLDAKVNAISLLTQRAIAHAGDEVKHKLVQPVFGLLWAILERKGEVALNSSVDMLAQMRLSAATALLDLASCRRYEAMITPLRFNLLATIIQDQRFTVREKFGEALMTGLGHSRLPMRFLAILFLVAFDPETEFKERVKRFLRNKMNSPSITDPARAICSTLSRLLHLLAHDSDFSLTTPDLLETAKFIEFFIASVATSDNISLIYSAAAFIKRTEDVLVPPKNQNLYAVSDLAVHVINSKRISHGWIITPHPAPIQLPGDLFHPLSQRPGAPQSVPKSYLPDDFFNQASKTLLTPSQFREKIEKQNPTKENATKENVKEKEKEKEKEPNRAVDTTPKGPLKRPAKVQVTLRKNAARKTRSLKKLDLSDDDLSDDQVSLYQDD